MPEDQDKIIAALKEFAGQKFGFSVFADPEPLALLRVLDAVLKSAGWLRVPSQISAIVVDVAGNTAGAAHDSESRSASWYRFVRSTPSPRPAERFVQALHLWANGSGHRLTAAHRTAEAAVRPEPEIVADAAPRVPARATPSKHF